MDFALLGDDLRALPLARAIVASHRHTLLWTVLAPRCHAELLKLHSGLRSCASWEELLSGPSIDAVIVCGDDERVLTAMRQLPAAGKSLAILPVPGQTSALVYELTLIQADAAVHLVPLFPLQSHPLLIRLHDLIAEGTLGRVHHVQLERRMVPAESGPAAPLLSAGELSSAFLGDVDVLRFLGGNYDQVTASRSGDAGGGVSLATVTLGGTASPQAIWSATADRSGAAWCLTVAGAAGSATLSGDPSRLEFSLECSTPHANGEPAPVSADPGPWLLGHFESAVSGQRIRPDWTDLTRAFELLDAVDRSIRRRRTIDLHFEVPSERSVFKTQMTAAGCSLLVLTFVATVIYLVVANVFNLNDTVKHVARLLIFLPLGVFLVLQLLLFLTKPASPEN